MVFLTGTYAYKLKKSVDFGFLDYSTPEKRRHFLCEELRLNAPIAPDIYQQVLSLRWHGDHWAWAEPNTVGDESILQMREFPQSCLLSELFAAGQLTDRQIVRVGQRVAAFHQTTLTNRTITAFGAPDKIWQSVNDNFRATEKYIGIAQTQTQYDQTREFSEQFYQEGTDLFHRRQQQGKIRECHGDLHLRNICDWQGKIQLFDRIEFNQPFRFVDVLYDVAFTMMDLDAKGRPDWAFLFLNTYLEQTGDWDGLPILPFYLCRQAYVRAKVISFLLDDRQLSPEQKADALKTAKNYYQLAWQYTQRMQGSVIVMSGLSGSGKSTVAQYLAHQLPAVHIRSDAVRKQLGGIPLYEAGGPDLYCPAMTERVYAQLHQLAQTVTQAGFNVILDAKFDRSQWRSPLATLCQTQGIDLTFIHCYAPLDILKQRLTDRQGDISDATAGLLATQIEQWEPFQPEELAQVVSLDTAADDWQDVALALSGVGHQA